MKTEQGFVIEVIDDVAKVKVGRHNDCKNCGACPGNNSVIISANNKIGAKPGQRVTFEVKETNVISGAFIVFILPLIALFLGVFLGGLLAKYIGFNVRVFQIGGGILTFMLSIILVKVFDRAAAANSKSLPSIISIIK